MKTITLLDGLQYNVQELEEKAKDDKFYYNFLGKTAFSSSIIGTLLESPKNYWYNLKYGGNEESTALTLGKIIHSKALTPYLFEEQFRVVDVASRNTKKFKEVRLELGNDFEVITSREEEQGNRVVDTLLKNPAFITRLNQSQPEEPKVGEIFGYPFRAKADILKSPKLYDLKTTSNLKAFQISAYKYNYDSQAFIYCTLFDIKPQDFEFIVVDKGSLDIGVYSITEDFFNKGREKVEYALSVYQEYFEGKSEDEIKELLADYYITGVLS